MTVAELRAKLADMPDDMLVVILGDQNDPISDEIEVTIETDGLLTDKPHVFISQRWRGHSMSGDAV